MNFKNSSFYVQRQTDKLFRSCKTFVKAYVDDIIIFSKILHEHIKHLRQIFQLFIEKRISLTFNKSFIDYSFIQLLNQRVDSLNLTTSKKKIAIIATFKFLKSLNNLNHFLSLIDWLRHCIHRYAQKALSLQIKKTAFTRQFFKHDDDDKRNVIKSIKKKHAIRLTLENSFDDELIAFKLL